VSTAWMGALVAAAGSVAMHMNVERTDYLMKIRRAAKIDRYKFRHSSMPEPSEHGVILLSAAVINPRPRAIVEAEGAFLLTMV
jgi:hypothetical protein